MVLRNARVEVGVGEMPRPQRGLDDSVGTPVVLTLAARVTVELPGAGSLNRLEAVKAFFHRRRHMVLDGISESGCPMIGTACYWMNIMSIKGISKENIPLIAKGLQATSRRLRRQSPAWRQIPPGTYHDVACL